MADDNSTYDINKVALDQLISQKQIKTVFQPIISLKDAQVLGHEALSRIRNNPVIDNPAKLFRLAEHYGNLWQVEKLCRSIALHTAFVHKQPAYNKKLFVNVNSNTMLQKDFKMGFTKQLLDQYHITPHSVIFEISERSMIDDQEQFRLTVDHYRRQGFEIAIDDVGSGFSGLNLISSVYPDFIKLDMNLIRGIDHDRLKYALVKSMVEFAKASNILLIAEGIETVEELDCLIDLDVNFGQGYLIQHPQENIIDISNDLIEHITKRSNKKNLVFQNNIANTHIRNLVTWRETISPQTKASDVYDYCRKHPECSCLCVVDQNIPLGIIMRDKLGLRMSGNYGFALNQHKSISELMDCNFLSVDASTQISDVSAMAMRRDNDRLYDYIVATENDLYIGTVTIKDLLQKSTEIEVFNAKHTNPLSGLPGNILIEQQLEHCLNLEEFFTVAYLDIQSFKAFNDIYGIEKGDKIISIVSDLLKMYLTEGDFIGHVGGDDFIVILNGQYENSYFNKIVQSFNQEILIYYEQEDIENGYVCAINRKGIEECFPLANLTCVTEICSYQKYQDIEQITERLAELKKQARACFHLNSNKAESDKESVG